VKRLATFAWHSPPPTSVDEQLAVFDDGSAWLVVRRPRALSGPIGTFTAKPSKADLAALTASGPGPVVFEVLGKPGDRAAAALLAVAERVASKARSTPRATATFHAGPRAAVTGGSLAMGLLVVGAGTTEVEFELEPSKCTVHFTAGGQPIAWFPLPELGSGFVTPDAEGLGGLRRRAKVPPEEYGATAFDIASPGNATGVSIEVAGWLSEALPDERSPAPFAVRTADAPIPGAAPAATGTT
jgi:hypothetical protein